MEYVTGGSIDRQVRDYGGGLSEDLVRKYSKQVLKGLAYLHKKRVVHGDIKCEVQRLKIIFKVPTFSQPKTESVNSQTLVLPKLS